MRTFVGIALILFGVLAGALVIADASTNHSDTHYFGTKQVRSQNIQFPSHWRAKEVTADKIYGDRLNTKEIVIRDSNGRTRIRVGLDALENPVVEFMDEKGARRPIAR